MDITTPALLFPAISLLLLAYTNRFLTLAQVIRQLHGATNISASVVKRQIGGLKRRIGLIKYMQGSGVISFLLCALSMFALFIAENTLGQLLFGTSLLMLAISLILSLMEVVISTNALEVVLEDIEKSNQS
jgi:hypothetical protein